MTETPKQRDARTHAVANAERTTRAREIATKAFAGLTKNEARALYVLLAAITQEGYISVALRERAMPASTAEGVINDALLERMRPEPRPAHAVGTSDLTTLRDEARERGDHDRANQAELAIQILELRTEALEAGDPGLSDLCDLALLGDASSAVLCAQRIKAKIAARTR